MGRVVCLSGISGSGKSTLAKKMVEENGGDGFIASADDYFVENGEYKFNKAKLTDAHALCFWHFMDAIRQEVTLIIVANTNILSWEIAPYALAARAFGFDFEIITIMCPEDVAVARNVHGVDKKTINNQQHKLLTRWLPRSWKETKVEWQT